MGRNTFLMTSHEVHCHEPLDEGYLGILEYSTYKGREAVFAPVAGKPAVLATLAVVATALGADNILLFAYAPS